MKKILDKALDEINPNVREKKEVNRIVKNTLSKIKINNVKSVLGGSGAKDTWLKNSYDMDIYVVFNYEKYKNKNISEILWKSLKKNFKAERLHGSRDYFQIKKDKFTLEVIPILEIKKVEQAGNITDISQLHVKWVRKNSDARLREQIRLTKAFCKAQKVYGAESYIRGFSGYSLEILTIKYKGFINFLKKVSRWKSREMIGNKKDIINLNKSKKQSPLILIDPVQNTRNVSAALSREKYNMLIKSAKRFFKNPSLDLFHKKELNLDKIRKQKNSIIFEVIPIKNKKDIAGAKMIKCSKYIRNQMEMEGFAIKKHGFEWNGNAVFYLILEKLNLSETKKHYGPPSNKKERLKSFRKKWKNKKIYQEKDKTYVIINREFVKAKNLLKFLIKNDKNIKNMVKKIQIKS